LGTIWLAYIVAAFTASALFVAAGWRSRKSREPGFARSSAWMSHALVEQADPASSTGAGDAADSIHVALKRLRSLIQDQDARIDVAAEPGLLVRAPGDVLAEMAAELLALGVRAGPGGRFLFTASRHAGGVDIALSDDCAAEDAGLRRSQARTLAQHVAMQGGSLKVITQAGQGTTMTIRLACATDAPTGVAAPPAMPEKAIREPTVQLR
jgi:hypothetical protein